MWPMSIPRPRLLLLSYAGVVTASRTLWVLHLESPDDPRFAPALELLREGHAIGYRGVSISLGAAGLRCCTQASWRSDALSEERARTDFTGMQETIDELRKNRPDFEAVIQARPVFFSLVDDYGTGAVELCHMSDGKVVSLQPS
jgi:hypothetical protein